MQTVKKVTRTASNGNWWPSFKNYEGCKVVKINYKGRVFDALVNTGQSPALLKNSSSRYDELSIKPGEGIFRTAAGDGWCNSHYAFFNMDCQVGSQGF